MDLIQRIKKREAKVAVIGLGYVGLPLAVEKAKAGWNTLVGCDRNRILQAARAACSSAPPFGDGRAAERIVSIVSG